MQLLSLKGPSKAPGTLIKQSGAAGGQANTYDFTLDVQVAIPSRGMAEALEQDFPGAAAMYDAAEDKEDNDKYKIVRIPEIEVMASLLATTAPENGVQGVVETSQPIITGKAEVIRATLSLSKRAQVVVYRFRFSGQPSRIAQGLIEGLNRVVDVVLDPVQGNLFAGPKLSLLPGPGDIVTVAVANQEPLTGRVAELDGTKITLKEKGQEYVIDASQVIARFGLVQDGDTRAALEDWMDRCRRRGTPGSFGALTQAIQQHLGKDAPPSGGSYHLSAEIVEVAVEIQFPTADASEQAPATEAPSPRRSKARGSA